MVGEALIGTIVMLAIVASALALGVGIGKVVVHQLRKRSERPVCEVSAEKIEKTAMAALKAARCVRLESEQIDQDLRGAAHVLRLQ